MVTRKDSENATVIIVRFINLMQERRELSTGVLPDIQEDEDLFVVFGLVLNDSKEGLGKTVDWVAS